jgi:hypothetical protein
VPASGGCELEAVYSVVVRSPWTLFCAGILASSPIARSCQCVEGIPVCEGFWSSDTVFSGVVRAISKTLYQRDPRETREDAVPALLVRLDVEKTYRGTTQPSLEVVTGLGDMDCGYAFRVGERYLVYANFDRASNRLNTGRCHLTKPLSESASDLKMIAAMLNGPPVGRIYGRVAAVSGDKDLLHEKPLVGARIRVSGPRGSFETLSGKGGAYEVKGLQPGKYQVSASFSGYESYESGEMNVQAGGCTVQYFNLHRADRN